MKKDKPAIYAFIDSQNLNLGTSKDITKRGRAIYKGWSWILKNSEGIYLTNFV